MLPQNLVHEMFPPPPPHPAAPVIFPGHPIAVIFKK